MRLLSILFIIGLCFSASNVQAQKKAQENANEDETLKLLFVGDIMGHGPQITSAYDAKTKSYNYEPCFKYVKPIIEQADLAIGNLEVTLPGAPPYKGYPMFRSPDALGTAVKNAGFDVIVTSNNHSNDGRYKGIAHTIDVLRKLDIHQTGTFKNQKDRDALYPLIVYKKGFKLAFLNYTYDTNGLPTPAPAVVNLIDPDLIKKDIEEAKALKPDGIIVVMHWGLEYQLNESPVQKDLTKNMFAWGADLVIGAHPHVVQPIKEEYVKDENGEKVKQVVVYSMGNFISNQQKKNTDGGIMFEIELKKNKKTNKLTLGEHDYIPVWRYIERKNGKKTYYALPISAIEKNNPIKLSGADLNKMNAFAKTTRNHLSKFSSQERPISWNQIAKPSAGPAVGARKASYKKGVLPLRYVVKDRMGDFAISTRGDKKPTIAYYISQPVHRNQAENKDTLIKGKFEKVIDYQPENGTKKEETAPAPPNKGMPNGRPKSGEVPDEYKFIPKKKKGLPTDGQVKGGDPTQQAPTKPTQQEPKPPTKPGTKLGKYTIQFQASRNLYPESSLPFSNVEIEATKNGWYRYYTGSANTLADAKYMLAQVKTAGFPDAFITKKKRLPKLTDGVKGDEQVNVNMSYRVLFQSTKNYYEKAQLLFKDVVILEDGELFRYYAGAASSYSDADSILKIVQAKGFKDAYIVTFENGVPKK